MPLGKDSHGLFTFVVDVEPSRAFRNEPSKQEDEAWEEDLLLLVEIELCIIVLTYLQPDRDLPGVGTLQHNRPSCSAAC